ncbi:egress cysteine protease 1 [Plasmodium yoelii]|uniref:Egress cysteine protease 1 n=1 Tax=Plasmodium yoelii TaxID=5861 RepID=A0A077Y3S0_PLAYE|nr:egress cysteine protease 1 [Plasmodium yoelii]CDU16240.1 egress cysteine protease 1 [Plasmodium yoelii]VTZ72438.1 egress cysteine protease 1 [Plasmodium yoelii]|eukprot:XP_022811439.1 egress cysteine protease 1 [Plasmodium yoelii]
MKTYKIKYFLLISFFINLIKQAKSKIIISCFGKQHCKICHIIIRNCFLSGTSNLEKCIACEENYYETRKCIKQEESFFSYQGNNALLELRDQSLQDSVSEESMNELISNILDVAISRYENQKTDVNSMDDDYKSKIANLCLYLNFKDNYESAEKHKQTDVEHIEPHIQHIVKTFIHTNDNIEHMKNALKNPALCFQNPSEWVQDRLGYKENNEIPSVGIIPEKKLFKPFKNKSLMSSLYNANSKCNRTHCNRFADPNECEYNIRPLNQGTCGNCWAFASSTTVSAFRCRKGLGFAEPSIKYVTLCKNKYLVDDDSHIFGHYNDNVCHEGGHLSSYIEILDASKMLPTSFDVPYNDPIKGGECPAEASTWGNIWDGVSSLSKILNGYIYKGYFKISFLDYVQAGKTHELINILKDYIIEQGAIFVSMEISQKLNFDHDGEQVMLNCEYGEAPDHALVLIGFGDYIKSSGEKSSYWLIRNSWGSRWGDNGNFKMDMYGPGNCNGRVLFNAFPLLLKMTENKISKPLPNDMASTDIKMRYNHSEFSKNKKNKNRKITPNNYDDPFNVNPKIVDPPNNNHNDHNSIDNNDEENNERFYPPYIDPEYGPSYPSMNNNRRFDPSDIINHRNRLRRVFQINLTVTIGNFVYKRNIYSKRKNEYMEEFSCLRTYSMDAGLDNICRENCEKHIDTCMRSAVIGECLERNAPNYKCVYCGM